MGRVRLGWLLGWVLLVDGAAAEDDAAIARARKAFAEWRESVAAAEAAPDTDDEAEHEVKTWLSRNGFLRALGRTDLTAWDPEADRELLWHGLGGVAREAYTEGRPEASLTAARLLLERFPDHPDAKRVRALDMPSALVMSGEFARARDLLRKHAESLSDEPGALACLLRGDLARLDGDYADGKTDYRRAEERADGRSNRIFGRGSDWREETDAWSDGRAVRRGVAVRERLLGFPLPELRHEAGIGPLEHALAPGPHRLVVFHFSASDWSHAKLLQALDRTVATLGDERVRVVAATSFGRLHRDDGTPVMLTPDMQHQPVTRRDFRDRLGAFRREFHVAIPFAILPDGDEGEEQLVVTLPDRRVLYADGVHRPGITAKLVHAFAAQK